LAARTSIGFICHNIGTPLVRCRDVTEAVALDWRSTQPFVVVCHGGASIGDFDIMLPQIAFRPRPATTFMIYATANLVTAVGQFRNIDLKRCEMYFWVFD
jgi:hypothetical protein